MAGVGVGGGCVYTSKFFTSILAYTSLLLHLGSPGPAYVLSGQARLYRGVSHGNQDSHFLGWDSQVIVIHKSDVACRASAALRRWGQLAKPSLASVGPVKA